MTSKGSNKHTLRWALIVSLAIALWGVFAWVYFYGYFGGFTKVKPIDTEEFAKCAGDISYITIPDSVRIIGLGEATHGNVEFQQLKLDVFKLMVEKYSVRAFALEGDYGGCEAVNRYIHGGPGTAQEAAAAIGFPIYRTKEMAQLIDWMRNYNATAKEGEDLRFYGFDMQLYECSYQYLLEAAKTFAVPTVELEKLWDKSEGKYSASFTADQKAKVIEKVKQDLLQLNDSTTVQAVHFADMLLQNIAVGKVMDDGSKGIALRDSLMFVNTHWIMEQEEARGNECIFISGHNGHIGLEKRWERCWQTSLARPISPSERISTRQRSVCRKERAVSGATTRSSRKIHWPKPPNNADMRLAGLIFRESRTAPRSNIRLRNTRGWVTWAKVTRHSWPFSHRPIATGCLQRCSTMG